MTNLDDRSIRRAILPAAWALGTGVVLTSFILRPGATATGPVLAEIRSAVGMSGGQAALLSALPGLSFALSGAVAARLGHRIGAVGGLALCCALSAAGLVLRTATGSAALFLALTAIALLGAGLGNVLVPMAIKQRFPLHSGVWTAVYVTAVPLGALAPQLAAPVIMATGGSWSTTLLVWGWVSVAALCPWLVILASSALNRRRARAAARRGVLELDDGELGAALAMADERSASGAAVVSSPVTLADVARSPRARAMALFFGLQSMQAYVTFAWLPQIFRDAGLSLDRASLLVAVFSIWGIPGGFIVPAVVRRSRHLQAWVVFLAGLLVVGYAGLLLAPTTLPWLWPSALGIAGMCFQVALVLLTTRTRDYRVTAALSGFTQSAGYALASLGPFVVGWIQAATGGWSLPLILLAASAVPLGVTGWLACAEGIIDDEIGIGAHRG